MDELARRLATLEQELEQMRVAAVPAGAVQAFAVRTAPAGWLPCDGREISRQHYHRLFQAIGTAFGDGDGETTFHLPDLEGVFVRGWDAWGDVDPERRFGSLQEDAFQGHRHESLGHRHDAACQSAGEHTHALKIYGGTTYEQEKYNELMEPRRAEYNRRLERYRREILKGNFVPVRQFPQLEVHPLLASRERTLPQLEEHPVAAVVHYTSIQDGAHAHSVSVNKACETITSPAQADCGDPRVDTETRPKNLALLYCIKT